jgi:hypothetical protein
MDDLKAFATFDDLLFQSVAAQIAQVRSTVQSDTVQGTKAARKPSKLYDYASSGRAPETALQRLQESRDSRREDQR